MAATADDLLNALLDLKTAAADHSRLMLDISKNLTYVEAAIGNQSPQQPTPPQSTSRGQHGSQGGMSGGVQNAFQQTKGFAQNIYQAGTAATNAAGPAAGMAAGLAGGLAVAGFALFKFGEALKNAADDARRKTDELFQQMGRMASVSISLGAVVAERERNQIFRDRDVGEKVAGSARGLMESENNLNNNTQNLDALAQDLMNVWQELKNNILAKIIEPVDEIAAGIRAILVKLRILSKDQPVYDLGTWLTEIEENQKRKDDRFAAVVDDMRQGAGGDW